MNKVETITDDRRHMLAPFHGEKPAAPQWFNDTIARAPERPVAGAELHQAIGVGGRRLLGAADRDRDDALAPLDVDVDGRIADAVSGDVAPQRRERDAGGAGRPP